MKKYILIIIALCSLTACKTMKFHVLPEMHNRTERDTVERWRTDSVYKVRYVYVKGDTVVIHDTVQEFRNVGGVEKVYIEKCDSVPYEVRVEVPVRVRNWYDRSTSWGFWILLSVAILIVVVRIYIRRR